MTEKKVRFTKDIDDCANCPEFQGRDDVRFEAWCGKEDRKLYDEAGYYYNEVPEWCPLPMVQWEKPKKREWKDMLEVFEEDWVKTNSEGFLNEYKLDDGYTPSDLLRSDIEWFAGKRADEKPEGWEWSTEKNSRMCVWAYIYNLINFRDVVHYGEMSHEAGVIRGCARWIGGDEVLKHWDSAIGKALDDGYFVARGLIDQLFVKLGYTDDDMNFLWGCWLE